MQMVFADTLVIQMMNLVCISTATATLEFLRFQNGFFDQLPILAAIEV